MTATRGNLTESIKRALEPFGFSGPHVSDYYGSPLLAFKLRPPPRSSLLYVVVDDQKMQVWLKDEMNSKESELDRRILNAITQEIQKLGVTIGFQTLRSCQLEN